MDKTLLLNFSGVSDTFSEMLTTLIARKIGERSGDRIITCGTADIRVKLEIDKDIGLEGYRIEGDAGNEIVISGNDELGLMYGAGKFLRTAQYGENDGSGFTPGKWRGTSIPCKEVRGIYLATHFNNYYHKAPIEEIENYIQDLALWGYNAVTVWFDMHQYLSIHDSDAKAMIERLHNVLTAARRTGLKTGLLVLANEAYDGSPAELRADWTSGHDGYTGELPHYHVELCPSKPEALELLLRWREEVFQAFYDIEPDYFWIWPYDQGGCTCPACAPWGGNGYLKMAKQIAGLSRLYFPKAKIILSTWYFDCFTDGEWQAFAKEINSDPSWADYIMAEFPGQFPEYILENGVPGNLPLLGFPEISMFESCPWGGYGANPLPGYLKKMWNEAGNRLTGGFPYSEGIFEDINKIICSHFYWYGNGNVDDTIKEYIGFEYGTGMEEDILKAIYLLESTNSRFRSDESGEELPMVPHSDEELSGEERFVVRYPQNASSAYKLLHEADGKLSGYARGSWRWRILYLRSLIDHELTHNDFKTNERCEDAFEELIQIYHAEEGIYAIKPPSKRSNRKLGWK